MADGGSDVLMWARRPELAREITEAKRNSDYLPGINLPQRLTADPSLERVLAGATDVFVSVPSQTLRANLEQARDLIPSDAVVVSLMKGVEKGTGLRMSEVIAEVLGIGPSASPSRRARTSRSRSPGSSRPPSWCRPRSRPPPSAWRRSPAAPTSGRSSTRT
ncbi:Glycerol-3-phosphate dehydrogenase, NAD(P)+ [Clavibacter michiganensis]|uniref:Glycerol-3-phosphate dehydrogenase, NAD(P) n=1 Tax=Clavibacter michiganensis TaxID=28447 RepID=A0A251XT50_9MICO|nr:Glycerol-3-phosphate dehydrogenase, NAD(P)+ [Clavibacter michiganensis]